MGYLKKFLLAVVALGVLYAAIPLGLQWYWIHQLRAQGYQVSLKQFGVDFIFGEVSIRGLSLVSPMREELDILNLDAQWHWPSLWTPELQLKHLKMEGFRLNLAQNIAVGLLPRQEEPALTGFQDLFRLSWLKSHINLDLLLIKNLELCRQARECLKAEDFSLGRIQGTLNQDEIQLSHLAPLIIKGFSWRSPKGSEPQVFSSEIYVHSGTYTQDRLDIQNIQLTNAQYLESIAGAASADLPFQSHWGQVALSSLKASWGDGLNLYLGDLNLNNGRQLFMRNTDGQWIYPKLLSPFISVDSPSQAIWGIKSTHVHDARITWVDSSVVPTARTQWQSVALDMGPLDSQTPTLNTPLDLTGKALPQGSFKWRIDLQAFAPKPTLSFNGYFDDIRLESWQGYSRAWMNDAIEGGALNVSASGRVDAQKLSIDSRWQWSDLVLGPASELKAANKLLKDLNQTFSLVVPIHANLTPTASIASLTGQKVKMALLQQSRNQVAKAGATEGGSRFPKFFYEPNNAYLTAADWNRLKPTIDMMKAKPHLRLHFCPNATGGEWQALFATASRAETSADLLSADHEMVLEEHREILLKLINARGEVLRNRLLNAGVAVDQVIVCPPKIQMSATEMAYLQISF